MPTIRIIPLLTATLLLCLQGCSHQDTTKADTSDTPAPEAPDPTWELHDNGYIDDDD